MALCEGVDKIIDNLAEVRPTVLFSVPRIFNKIYTSVHSQIPSKPKAIQELVAAALKVTAKERAGQRLKLHELALLVLVDKVVFEKVRARFGGRLKYAVSGGAALSRDVAEFIDSLGIMIYEGYGLTETSPVATTNAPGARKIGSVGRPVPGVTIDIDAATGERKPADNGKPARFEGEIVVHGHNVMKGYLKRPEENAAVFTKDGGFKTGDMGYVDPHGFVYITGRIKEQYKLENGKYVAPTPLEEQLKLSPYVSNVMVYGDNRPYNVALIVLNLSAVKGWAAEHHVTLPAEPEAILKDDRVRALLKKELEKAGAAFKGFESIQDFALLKDDFTTDNGMLTPSLKLRRRKVVEEYTGVIDELYKAAARRRSPRPARRRDRRTSVAREAPTRPPPAESPPARAPTPLAPRPRDGGGGNVRETGRGSRRMRSRAQGVAHPSQGPITASRRPSASSPRPHAPAPPPRGAGSLPAGGWGLAKAPHLSSVWEM